MGFYDNFLRSDRGKTTVFAGLFSSFENNLFWKSIASHLDKSVEDLAILEIGPGKGGFARFCLSQGVQTYECLEANPQMAQNLENDNIKTFVGFAPPLPGKRNYDVILMNQVYEHMSDRQQALDLIEECHSRLSSGGLVVISSPEIRSWGTDFFAGDYTHNWPTSLYNTKQIVFDLDFTVVQETFYTLVFQGAFLSFLIGYLAHLFYGSGLLFILFQKKSYKIKTAMLPSFLIVCKK